VDNIKNDLGEIGWNDVDWIDLARDSDQWRADMSLVMNLRVPRNAEKFLSSCRTGGLSRRLPCRYRVNILQNWRPLQKAPLPLSYEYSAELAASPEGFLATIV
jgi:hypothetical protein